MLWYGLPSCAVVRSRRPYHPPDRRSPNAFRMASLRRLSSAKCGVGRPAHNSDTARRRIGATAITSGKTHAINTVSEFDTNRDLAGKIMDKGFCPR